LLGEALCSSFEAFRFTRKSRDAAKDEQDELPAATADLSHSRWYLGEFDRALERCSGSTHPKVSSTVRTVVDLWEAGEKVLVFAFYRYTCRALRVHISQEIEQRILATGKRRLHEAGHEGGPREVEHLLDRIQKRYFDDADSPGRRAVDAALAEIMRSRAASLDKAQVSEQQRDALTYVLRRFLRVSTTLVRCFPLAELDSIQPTEAVTRTINHTDVSGVSWRQKFDGFIEFLTEGCSSQERRLYLEAAGVTRTGGIRVEDAEDEDTDGDSVRRHLVQWDEAKKGVLPDARKFAVYRQSAEAGIQAQRQFQKEIRTRRLKQINEFLVAGGSTLPLLVDLNDPEVYWRVDCMMAWHNAIVAGHPASRDYADFLCPYVNDNAFDEASYARFWLQDVQSHEMPKNRLVGLVGFYQAEHKITHGNPMDQIHADFLLDVDSFITAARAFHSVLVSIAGRHLANPPRLICIDRANPSVLDQLAAML
jgi:hypothetical protein